MAVTSEPAFGSVMANAAHFGTDSRKTPNNRFICSGEPSRFSIGSANPGPGNARYRAASPYPISSPMIILSFTDEDKSYLLPLYSRLGHSPDISFVMWA